MTISSAQAEAMANRQASTKRQDTSSPLLINIKDGRLMPNVPNIRSLPDYRPYHGDPKANTATRMAYLRSGGHGANRAPAPVIFEDVQPFDVSKATKDELIAFAMNEYGLALDASADIRTLRKKVADAADAAGSLA